MPQQENRNFKILRGLLVVTVTLERGTSAFPRSQPGEPFLSLAHLPSQYLIPVLV